MGQQWYSKRCCTGVGFVLLWCGRSLLHDVCMYSNTLRYVPVRTLCLLVRWKPWWPKILSSTAYYDLLTITEYESYIGVLRPHSMVPDTCTLFHASLCLETKTLSFLISLSNIKFFQLKLRIINFFRLVGASNKSCKNVIMIIHKKL